MRARTQTLNLNLGLLLAMTFAAMPSAAQAVRGTGTTNTLTLWTSPSTIGDSTLSQSGTNLSTNSLFSAAGLITPGKLTVGASGGFGGAVTAASFTGNGAGLSNVNAVTLGGISPTGFAQLGANNNAFSGAITAASFTGNGSALTSLNPGNLSSGTANISISGNAATATNATQLNGLSSSAFAQLGAANNFTVTQTISSGDLSISSGNLNLPGTSGSTVGVLTVGGFPFLHSYGTNNTFLGQNAGNFTLTGQNNTASGFQALFSNTTGTANVADGGFALGSNTIGGNNTALGYAALGSNTTGSDNTAIGLGALDANTTGGGNTASGRQALWSNTTGSDNTAIGRIALFQNNTGAGNIAIGTAAGYFVTGSNNIDIGNGGGVGVATGESGVIRIGSSVQTSTFIAGISGVSTGLGGAQTVLVDANGQLGTISSSRRFKYDIENMGEASSDLMKLRPVTFRYKQAQEDGSHPLQYGLVAEEVADVYPGLVALDKAGEPQSVLYHVLPAMLLNEVQKQHQQIEAQQQVIQSQQELLKVLEERLRRLETLPNKGN